EENREHLEHIHERVKARCVGFELRKNPQMKRALDNFKAVLDLRVNQGGISDAQLKQIIGVIDRAALEISQLD
ncbi:MAG: PadR family transcriptional regulator, partial [Klebsiella pneumoniae]|nr:PadR family transcriptional regulator [Klebsiella pneumoniae]